MMCPPCKHAREWREEIDRRLECMRSIAGMSHVRCTVYSITITVPDCNASRLCNSASVLLSTALYCPLLLSTALYCSLLLSTALYCSLRSHAAPAKRNRASALRRTMLRGDGLSSTAASSNDRGTSGHISVSSWCSTPTSTSNHSHICSHTHAYTHTS
jgi:hypothetical protein